MKTLKPLYFLSFFAFCLLMNNIQLNAQALYYGPDKIVNEGDSVILRLHDYVGNIQWQKSYNKKNWNNISGATDDTLLFIADKTTYFRAEVTAGNCDPYYSDKIYVNVMKLQPNVANIDSTDLTLLSDSIEQVNGIYKYKLADSNVAMPINAVFYSAEGGYARKVDSVVKTNNEIKLYTKQAKLTDIIKNINLKDSIKILSYDNRYLKLKSSMNYEGRMIPIQLSPHSNKRLKSYDNEWEHTVGEDGFEYKDDFSFSPNDNFDLSITGSIKFLPTFYREIVIQEKNIVDTEPFCCEEWSIFNAIFNNDELCADPLCGFTWPNFNCSKCTEVIDIPKFEKFKFTANGALKFDLVFLAEAHGEWGKPKNANLNALVTIPLALGPVPATIEIKPYAGYEPNFEVKAALWDRIHGEINRKFGIEYNYDATQKWTRIKEGNETLENEFDFILIGKAGVKAKAGVEVRFDILSVFGPSVTAYPYADLYAEVNNNTYDWGASLKLGINADLSAEAFGYKVASLDFGNKPNILDINIIDPLGDDDLLLFNNLTLDVNNPTNIQNTSVSDCEGIIQNNPTQYPILERGILYWKEGETINDAKYKSCNTNCSNTYSVDLYNLEEGITYKIKSYATLLFHKSWTDIEKEITVESDVAKQFTTKAPPEVNTLSYSNVTKYAASVTGKISSDGNSSIKEYGVYYSINATVDKNDSKCTDCSSPLNADGTFNCNLNNLQPDQDYWVKTYAINDYGETLSDNTKTFKTEPEPPPITAPTIGGVSATNKSGTSATIEVSGIDNGGGTISEGGVCYVKAPGTPVYPGSNCKSASDPTGGSFSVQLTGLSKGTEYNYKAYVVNETGNPGTKSSSFETVAAGTPIVTITNHGGDNTGDLTVEYNVDLNSGTSITERGLILDGVKQPSDGTGDGDFSKTISVSQDNIHNIKVYATNADGNPGESSIKTYGWSKCYPKNESNWTGFVRTYGTGFPDFNIVYEAKDSDGDDNSIRVGYSVYGKDLRGWASFDISNIPTNSTVKGIDLSVYNTQEHTDATLIVTSMSVDPANVSKNKDIYDETENGYQYITSINAVKLGQSPLMPLGTQAKSDIQNAITNQKNKWSIGFNASGLSKLLFEDLNYRGYLPPNSPYIIVIYE